MLREEHTIWLTGNIIGIFAYIKFIIETMKLQ